MSNVVQVWRDFFCNWPAELPQRGVVVTNFNEQVPFVSFLMTEHMLMLERMAPDANGGRRMLLPYDFIVGVKITDPVKNEVFSQAGFLQGGQKNAPKPRVPPRRTEEAVRRD
jgi:hypothetical protein